ncbi:MAG: transcription termination/antitermination NusG family protein, partial [Alteromonas macleodii]|nr:transcription termination/antitermination NusG family protein [Alteromonas macleodii]
MSEEEAVKKRWYVVQAYSQYESRVKKTLLEYIKMHNMEDYFGQVLVPTEEVVE